MEKETKIKIGKVLIIIFAILLALLIISIYNFISIEKRIENKKLECKAGCGLDVLYSELYVSGFWFPKYKCVCIEQDGMKSTYI